MEQSEARKPRRSLAAGVGKALAASLAGFALIGLVAARRPGEIGYAFMAAGGLALSAPFAVVTSAPRAGTWLSRFGVARMPEETAPSAALLSLRRPEPESLRPRSPRAALKWRFNPGSWIAASPLPRHGET